MTRKRLLIVANNSRWASWPEKIAAIRAFFLPKLDIDIDLIHTNYTDIPFENVVGIHGIENAHINTRMVAKGWFDRNVTAHGLSYDMVLFQVAESDRKSEKTAPMGIRTDMDQGPMELTMFANESDHAYVMKDGRSTDLGNSFVLFSCHEISHGLYAMLGKEDKTHLHFYTGHPYRVLSDFNFPDQTQSILDRIRRSIAFLSFLLKDRKVSSTVDDLIKAMIQVESVGDDYAVGDLHLANRAYGPLQIRQPAVDDVNSYFQTNYVAKDMWGNRPLSVETFKKYMEIYATPANVGREVTLQDMARIWNGGPDGWKKLSTSVYWDKVKARL